MPTLYCPLLIPSFALPRPGAWSGQLLPGDSSHLGTALTWGKTLFMSSASSSLARAVCRELSMGSPGPIWRRNRRDALPRPHPPCGQSPASCLPSRGKERRAPLRTGYSLICHLTATLRGWNLHPCSTDEESEVQRGRNGPKCHST